LEVRLEALAVTVAADGEQLNFPAAMAVRVFKIRKAVAELQVVLVVLVPLAHPLIVSQLTEAVVVEAAVMEVLRVAPVLTPQAVLAVTEAVQLVAVAEQQAVRLLDRPQQVPVEVAVLDLAVALIRTAQPVRQAHCGHKLLTQQLLVQAVVVVVVAVALLPPAVMVECMAEAVVVQVLA
jgi:hypothetical protein